MNRPDKPGKNTLRRDDPPAAPARAEGAGAAEPGGPEAERQRIKRIIEALLFCSDRPLTARRLAELSGAPDGRVARELARELKREYDAEERAFSVEEVAGGFQLLTRPEYAPWVANLENRRRQESLSKAALETLAIVAYRQPITRAELEDIRGVQSGHILRALIERRLLRVVGKSQELGRPLLYGTTRYFLETFGLRSLSELPRTGRLADAARLPKEEPEPAGPAPQDEGAAVEQGPE